MSRDYLTVALAAAQIVGAVATMLAIAIQPLQARFLPPVYHLDIGPAFWLCLVCVLSAPIGFLVSFRQSQLAF